MPFYQRQGQIPPKRHTQFRSPEGKLRFEELISTRGFEGQYALLYHENNPVEVLEARALEPMLIEEWVPDGQLNRSIHGGMVEASGDIFDSRRLIAFNDELMVYVATPTGAPKRLFRNGMGDELLMVIDGAGRLRTAFGLLEYEEGDMVIIPRGVTYEFTPEGDDTRLLIVESNSPIAPPKRYLVDGGQWAEHAPMCERDFKTPALMPPITERGAYRVVAKVGERLTEYLVPNHPFDVIGWDGSHYPFAVNIRNFEPVTRRIHTMPDEQQAFETAGAAICCFVPRMADYHPDAIPAPPIHSNVDSDELLLNLSGKILGWKGGQKGLITYHPRGLHHAAKVYEESIGMTSIDGTALAIDTFRPLKLTKHAEAFGNPEYYKVWLKAQPAPDVAAT